MAAILGRVCAAPRCWSGLLLALAVATGCSHAEPYYRSPVAPVARPEPAAIEHRLVLIGDAGAPDPEGEPALEALAHQVRLAPDRTTVVFLGDNVHETGMPAKTRLDDTVVDDVGDALDDLLFDLFASRADAERRIDAQIDAASGSGTRAIFIPGEQDWHAFGVGGWKRLHNLQAYLDSVREQRGIEVRLLPRGGCPGPVRVLLGARAVLLVLDTQWWLGAGIGGKPGEDRNPTGCTPVSEEGVAEALREELVSAAEHGLDAVVVGHHPLETKGPHGGFADLEAHLFPLSMLGAHVPIWSEWIPLPVLGSLLAGLRACCSPSAQDLPGAANRRLRRALLQSMRAAAFAGAAPLLYAAGHDHSLQLFAGAGGARYSAVSGLGSSARASGVSHAPGTLFAHSNAGRPGFMLIDFLRDGAARLAVVEWTPGRPGGVEVFSLWLDGG